MDEVRVSFTESECARMIAVVNWLMGHVQGSGTEIPDSMILRLLPLAKAAKMDQFYPEQGHG